MYMKTVSLFFTIITIIVSCGESSTSNKKNDTLNGEHQPTDTTPATGILYDTSRIAVLQAESNISWVIKDAKPATLTQQDIQAIDQLLTNCIALHNTKQDSTKRFSEYIDLKMYKRQYVPYTDAKGARKVYVNCFCRMDAMFGNWRENIVEVRDGGRCFFNVTIKLTKLQYEQLFINGYG